MKKKTTTTALLRLLKGLSSTTATAALSQRNRLQTNTIIASCGVRSHSLSPEVNEMIAIRL